MKPSNRMLSALAFAATVVSSAFAGEGTVVSAIETDIYTYVEVAQGGHKLWIAGPKAAFKAGDTIQFADGMMMSNFHSKQLQRTFPAVMFVQQMAVTGSAAATSEASVISAVDTDIYTYVEVSQGGRNFWIAGPKATVKAGDRISFTQGMMMSNFFSKQLQRTFPAVMFVDQMAVAGAGK